MGKTLLETLNESEPETEEQKIIKLSGKEFATAVLDSTGFKIYIVSQIQSGVIPSAIITRLMDQAWGKPAQKLTVEEDKGKVAIDEQTEQELEVRLAEVQKKIAAVKKRKSVIPQMN